MEKTTRTSGRRKGQERNRTRTLRETQENEG